jgi:hypothetical protein
MAFEPNWVTGIATYAGHVCVCGGGGRPALGCGDDGADGASPRGWRTGCALHPALRAPHRQYGFIGGCQVLRSMPLLLHSHTRISCRGRADGRSPQC